MDKRLILELLSNKKTDFYLLVFNNKLLLKVNNFFITLSKCYLDNCKLIINKRKSLVKSLQSSSIIKFTDKLIEFENGKVYRYQKEKLDNEDKQVLEDEKKLILTLLVQKLLLLLKLSKNNNKLDVYHSKRCLYIKDKDVLFYMYNKN